MARKKRSKERDIWRHVKNRFHVRWGIDLTQELHDEFIREIQNGKGKLVEKQSNRVSVWDIIYKDKTMTVVYDKERKMLVTVFPEGADIKDRFIYDNKIV